MKRLLKNTLVAAGLCACIAANTFASEPFIGEIRWVSFNFAPRGWAFCDGQLLSISEHDALYSLLGTTYGGDGRTTFALPDLRGRVLLHAGQGPGRVPRSLGDTGGDEAVSLGVEAMPAHTHRAMASTDIADRTLPHDRVLAVPKKHRHHSRSNKKRVKIFGSAADIPMDESAIGHTGGGGAHENMPPFTTLNCIIALFGLYPSQN